LPPQHTVPSGMRLDEIRLDASDYGGWITPRHAVEFVDWMDHEAHVRREHGMTYSEALRAGFVRFMARAGGLSLSLEGTLDALRRTYRDWAKTALSKQVVQIDIANYQPEYYHQGIEPYYQLDLPKDRNKIIGLFGPDSARSTQITEGVDLRRFSNIARGELNFVVPVDAVLHTNGRGFHSRVAKAVRVTRLVMFIELGTEYISDLRVDFDPHDWDVQEDGLIYTDPLWLHELQQLLHTQLGIPAEIAHAVGYSEQGMQGEDWVSCDANELGDYIQLQYVIGDAATIPQRKREIMHQLLTLVKAEAYDMTSAMITKLRELGADWPEFQAIQHSISATLARKQANESDEDEPTDDYWRVNPSSVRPSKPRAKRPLTHRDPVERWIAVFKASKHPNFAGKSAAERERQARMAHYRAVQNHKAFTITEAKRAKRAKTLIDGMIKTLVKRGRTHDEAVADLKRQVDSRFYEAIDALVRGEVLEESLRDWFRQKWVRFGPDGKIRGACARGSDSEGKPKCLPQAKAHALGKKKRATAARRKRRQDPNPDRRGKAHNVRTKESVSEHTGLTPELVRRLQRHLNDRHGANLDVDGVLGPLTLASIRQFLPGSAKAAAPHPNRTTAVQGLEKKSAVDERCWTGYQQQGMKKKGARLVPNCVKAR
jgi:hypothetical protein